MAEPLNQIKRRPTRAQPRSLALWALRDKAAQRRLVLRSAPQP
jgi:hypothetical protein